MNLQIFLSKLPHLEGVLWIIVVAVLPARSAIRYFQPQPHKLKFFPVVTKCLLLIILYTIIQTNISSDSLALAYLTLGDWIGLSVKIILCCTTILVLDYTALRLQLRKRIQLATTEPEKIRPLQPQLIFFKNHNNNTIAVAIYCILSGIWEEAIFREYCYQLGNSMSWNPIFVMTLSSVIFAVNHSSGGYRQMAFSLFFGFLFFTLFIFTGSLIAVTIGHISGNLFAVFYAVPHLNKKTRAIKYF